MNPKILINSSNLHNGGGIQVAVSFLHEISYIDTSDIDLTIWASTEVTLALKELNSPILNKAYYNEVNLYGIKAVLSKFNKKIKEFSTVFTIFGPNYLFRQAKNEIVGFAQLWIIDFYNPTLLTLSKVQIIKLKIKFFIQWVFFKRAKHLIVELEHVKDKLIKFKNSDPRKIDVIHNTVSSIYYNIDLWVRINIKKQKEKISLGIITRDYPHKNLCVLPKVGDILLKKYNLPITFYVSLNEDEWIKRDSNFKKYVSTVGALSPAQCPSFYEQIDGVIFPSLLECFSATPLEALIMRKPLFASDRQFVKDVCGKYAIYFDPLDPESIADKIYSYFHNNNNMIDLEKARNHAMNFSTAKGRAESYLKILRETTLRDI